MVTNPFTRASQSSRQASDMFGAVGRGTQGAETLPGYAGNIVGSMNQFTNPYYDQVIDAALGRLGQTRDQNLLAVRDQAEAAGAFGGARQGLVEAEVMDDYTQSAGDLSSQLYQRMFDTSLGAAQQAENQRLANLQMKQAAGQNFSGLADQYFGFGRNIMDTQSRAGAMQRQLAQQLLTGGNEAFRGYATSPMQAIDLVNAVLSGDPRQAATTSSQTQTTQPGMFDYISMGTQMGGRLMGKK
jgi:hypothetical protein